MSSPGASSGACTVGSSSVLGLGRDSEESTWSKYCIVPLAAVTV